REHTWGSCSRRTVAPPLESLSVRERQRGDGKRTAARRDHDGARREGPRGRQTRQRSTSIPTCVDKPPMTCANENERCSAASDCCVSGDSCINGRCSQPPPLLQ